MHEFQIDKFNKNIDKIFRIELGEKENSHACMPEIVARKIAEDLPEIKNFARFGITEGDDILKYNKKALIISDLLFADKIILSWRIFALTGFLGLGVAQLTVSRQI
jgi:hypothetical protein